MNPTNRELTLLLDIGPFRLPVQPSVPIIGTKSPKPRRRIINVISDSDTNPNDDGSEPKSGSDGGSEKSITNVPKRKKQKLTHQRSSTPKSGLAQTTTVMPKTPPTLPSGSDHHPTHGARDIDEASTKRSVNTDPNISTTIEPSTQANPLVQPGQKGLVPGEGSSNIQTNKTHSSTQDAEEIATPEVVIGEGQTEDLADVKDDEQYPETTAEE